MRFSSVLAIVAATALLAIGCSSASSPTDPGPAQPDPVGTQPGTQDGPAVDGQGATIVVNGETYELTEVNECRGFPSLAPPVVGFQGETADGEIRVGASLPQAVDVVVGGQSFQVIGGTGEGELNVQTSVQGDLVVGQASGTAALIDGSGPTVNFDLTVACPPPGA